MTGDGKVLAETHQTLSARLETGSLIYVKDTDIKIISLSRTGTHSDLFDKKNKLKAK